MTGSARTCSTISAVAALILLQAPAKVRADDNRPPLSVTVSFGVGLNTAGLPPNPANHHVLPKTIEVQTGGVVNFAVAGFHQIFVYNPGKSPRDVVPNANPAALFIGDLTDLYYQGILPAGGPPPGIPATTNPSNAVNRIESVSFLKPGRYLVICNVAPHFADGMWAWVRVSGGGHDHH
jgi:plastocyanin